MGGFFSAPKAPAPPDNSAILKAQQEAEAKAKAEADALKAKQEEEERAFRTGRRGRRSLLGPGGETGFSSILGG